MLSMSEAQIRKAAEQAFGKPMRIKIIVGSTGCQAAAAAAPKRTAPAERRRVDAARAVRPGSAKISRSVSRRGDHDRCAT